jgi:hypothetical protein
MFTPFHAVLVAGMLLLATVLQRPEEVVLTDGDKAHLITFLLNRIDVSAGFKQ